jgi:hypothetical protein
MPAPSTWDEMWFSRDALRERYRGERLEYGWSVPLATTKTDLATYLALGEAAPGESGLWAPRLVRARLTAHPQKKAKRVIGVYETPTWREIVRDNPGNAILRFEVSGDAVTRKYDDRNEQITGRFPEADGTLKEWVVTKGRAVGFVARCHVLLDVAVSSTQATALMALVGKCNNAALPNFGNAAEHTLLFLGATSRRALVPNTLYHMTYAFDVDPEGFFPNIEVRAYRVVAKQVPVVDEDGNDVAGKTRETISLLDPGLPQNRYTIQEGDFSILDGMLNW